jgi:hypothetical protein
VECFTLFLFLEDVKSRLRLMGNYSRSVNVDIHVAGVIGMTAEGGGGGEGDSDYALRATGLGLGPGMGAVVIGM